MKTEMTVPWDRVKTLQADAILSDVETTVLPFKDMVRMAKERMARTLANKLLESVDFEVRQIDLGTRIRARVIVITEGI